MRFIGSRRQGGGDNPRNILAQAENLGLRPLYGGRQGICASCTCTLISGAVRDMRSGEIASEPGQPIRLCVNAPNTDVEIDL